MANSFSQQLTDDVGQKIVAAITCIMWLNEQNDIDKYNSAAWWIKNMKLSWTKNTCVEMVDSFLLLAQLSAAFSILQFTYLADRTGPTST